MAQEVNLFTEKRENLVEKYIKPEVKDRRVIAAFLAVPRHEFVPEECEGQAYEDYPLPIGGNQTISQPSLVAKMVELLQLKGDERVLEVGTGSGYQTAILAELAKKVYSIERIEGLAKKARKVLAKQGYNNVQVVIGDGSKGLSQEQPFDGIIVSAAADNIPQDLIKQLGNKGRLVIPVREIPFGQMLKVGIKENGKISFQDVEPVVFVPLVSASEFPIRYRNKQKPTIELEKAT